MRSRHPSGGHCITLPCFHNVTNFLAYSMNGRELDSVVKSRWDGPELADPRSSKEYIVIKGGVNNKEGYVVCSSDWSFSHGDW